MIFETDKVRLFRKRPEPNPVVVFAAHMSMGAQNFVYIKAMTEQLRAAAWFRGVTEAPLLAHEWELEAYGETRAACEDAASRYLAAFPWEHWRTRFGPVRDTALGFVSRGTRWQIKDWLN